MYVYEFCKYICRKAVTDSVRYGGMVDMVLAKFIFYQLMDKRIALKGVLKFTLKQLQCVPV